MPDRARLAADQARLLDALLHDARPPAGFDPKDVAFAGRMLRDKRARVADKRARLQSPERLKQQRGPWARLRKLWLGVRRQ